MSGTEWNGAPDGGDSWAGYGPQAAAGEPAAERQPPTVVGPPTFGNEPWYANRPPVEAHRNWYQPLPSVRRRRPGRALAAVGVVAVVIIGAAAAAVIMSPKHGSPRATAAPKSGSPHASSSSSARVSSRSSHAGSRLTAAQAVAMASRKSAQLRSVSATLTEQVSGAASATVTATMTEQRDPLLASMHLTENADGLTIRLSEIVNTDAFYVRFNRVPQGMPAGLAHKWIEIPFAQLASGSVLGTLMRTVQNENPMSQTQLLAAARHIRAVGLETIGGVSTKKYTGWFSPSAALKYVAPSLRTALGPVMKLVNGNIAISVWIDRQHRIRKFTEVESLEGSTARTTCTFSGFNRPVHITMPPASEVVTPPASALSSA